jgi:hypothetical protein
MKVREKELGHKLREIKICNDCDSMFKTFEESIQKTK